MHATSLRKVGGSVMLAVPPALLDVMHLQAGAKVGLSVENGRLVVQAQPRPLYSLEELLAQCDASAPDDAEAQAWIDDKAMGGELI